MRHIISKSRKHKKEYGTVVKEYEFIRPETDEVYYLVHDTDKDWKNICFQSFKCRCIRGIKFTNKAYNEKVVLTIDIGFLKFKSQIYGINKKIKDALKKRFRFSEIVKLTRKTDSSLSNRNTCF